MSKLYGRLVVGLVMLAGLAAPPGMAAEAPVTASELEKYIRIQIEIGAAMKEFFSTMQPGRGTPPPEQREAMVEEIDRTVADILKKYDLTTEEYNRRKKEVFKDEAVVQAFLDRHPDLKAQWEALPFRGGGGHGRRPPGAE